MRLHEVICDDGNGNELVGVTSTPPHEVADGDTAYVFIYSDKENGFQIAVGDVKGKSLKHRVSDSRWVG